MSLIEARHTFRACLDETGNSPGRERQARRGGNRRHDQAFHEQLTQHATAARAQGRPHCNLSGARSASREEQVRNVHARDQQHDNNRAEKHVESSAIIADEFLHQRNHLERQLLCVFRKLHAQPLRCLHQVGVGPLDRDPRLQSPIDGQIVLVVRGLALRRERDRHPEFFRVRIQIERGRHHADDTIGLSAQPDVLTDDRRIGSEASRPEPMAQDDDLLVTRLILRVGVRATERRPHAEDGEERRGRPRADDPFRRSRERQVEARILNRRHSLERRRPRLRIDEIACGDVSGAPPEVLVHGNDPLGLWQRKRMKHDSMDRAEDGCRGANAKSEGHNPKRGESRAGHELADGKAGIACEVADVSGQPHIGRSS